MMMIWGGIIIELDSDEDSENQFEIDRCETKANHSSIWGEYDDDDGEHEMGVNNDNNKYGVFK